MRDFTVIEAEIRLVKTMLAACYQCDFQVQGSKFENQLVFSSSIYENIVDYNEQLENQLVNLKREAGNCKVVNK